MTKSKSLLTELRDTADEIWRAIRFLSPYQRLTLGSAVFFMAGVGWCTAEVPLLIGGLVDDLFKHRVTSMSGAAPALVQLAGILILRECLQVGRKIIVERTCTSVESAAIVGGVAKLLKIDLAALGRQRSGSISGRLNRSVNGLVRLLKLSFLDLLPAVIGATFALSAAIGKNWVIGAVMAAIVPIGFAVILIQLMSQKGIRVSMMREKEKVDGTVVELIGGIETIRAADTTDFEIGKVSTIADELQRIGFRHHVAMAVFDALKSLNEGAFHISILALALYLTLSGAITPGDILAFSMLFMAVLTPLREIHRIIDEAHESAIAAKDYFEMVDQPEDRSFEAPDVEKFNLSANPIVVADGLVVDYRRTDEAPGKRALDGVSLTIGRGEIVGFAGPSGSGKSTFIRALLRLVHPTGGVARICGLSIESLSRGDVGRLVGFVGQTPFLFEGTVAENIAYGCPAATLEDIRAAAAMARIAEEIESLPLGYAHMLIERGNNLSGGQRQRVALARALLQDPPILILDEATAALDNENERAVMEAVVSISKEKTILMIAHRLSSLEHADRIFVFESGRVVQTGTFAELAQGEGGLFAKLLYGDDYPALKAGSTDLAAAE